MSPCLSDEAIYHHLKFPGWTRVPVNTTGYRNDTETI